MYLEHHAIRDLELVAIELPGEHLPDLVELAHLPRLNIRKGLRLPHHKIRYPLFSVAMLKRHVGPKFQTKGLELFFLAAQRAEAAGYDVFTIYG